MIEEQVLNKYYKELFPIDILKMIFDNSIEIAYVLNNDVWVKFQNLQSLFMNLKIKKSLNITSIHIGGIYDYKNTNSKNITQNSESNYQWILNKKLKNYLRIDVDLNDSEFLRKNCCKLEKKVCETCFNIIQCFMKITSYIMNRFFEEITYFFVFSGNKGIHCWILELDEKKKKIILSFLKSIMDRDCAFSLINSNDLNPEILYIYKTFMKPCYLSLGFLEEQLNNDVDLNLLNNFKISFDKKIENDPKHLLKAPFSIHPKTGYLCLIINRWDIEYYNLSNIPKLDINGYNFEEFELEFEIVKQRILTKPQ